MKLRKRWNKNMEDLSPLEHQHILNQIQEKLLVKADKIKYYVANGSLSVEATHFYTKEDYEKDPNLTGISIVTNYMFTVDEFFDEFFEEETQEQLTQEYENEVNSNN